MGSDLGIADLSDISDPDVINLRYAQNTGKLLTTI